MRTIRYTSCFKLDYQREKSGRHGKKLDASLMEMVNLLATDKPLAHRHFDHPLSGEWSDHRDCHIKPDLILIYRRPDDDHLDLVRLGSHSELGLQSRFSLNRVSPTAAGHAHEIAGLPFSNQYRPLEVSLYTAAPLLAIWGRGRLATTMPMLPFRENQ